MRWAAAVILVLGLVAGCGGKAQKAATTEAASTTMPAAAAGCTEGDTAPLGVLRSTDHGAT